MCEHTVAEEAPTQVTGGKGGKGRARQVHLQYSASATRKARRSTTVSTGHPGPLEEVVSEMITGGLLPGLVYPDADMLSNQRESGAIARCGTKNQ